MNNTDNIVTFTYGPKGSDKSTTQDRYEILEFLKEAEDNYLFTEGEVAEIEIKIHSMTFEDYMDLPEFMGF